MIHMVAKYKYKLAHGTRDKPRGITLLVLQKEQEQHNTEIGAFVEEVKAIHERLVKARVISGIEPIPHQLAIEGRIPNTFYPQVYEEAIPTSVGPSALTPILRPTNPKLPSKVATPYIPKAPTYKPLPLPPKMEYTAKSTSGPLHQPTMFDTEENHRWPLLSVT
jgi:hypothetical protein